MNKEEYLNSLSKEDILNGIGWYLLDHNDIPEDVSPEDIWSVIADLINFRMYLNEVETIKYRSQNN